MRRRTIVFLCLAATLALCAAAAEDQNDASLPLTLPGHQRLRQQRRARRARNGHSRGRIQGESGTTGAHFSHRVRRADFSGTAAQAQQSSEQLAAEQQHADFSVRLTQQLNDEQLSRSRTEPLTQQSTDAQQAAADAQQQPLWEHKAGIRATQLTQQPDSTQQTSRQDLLLQIAKEQQEGPQTATLTNQQTSEQPHSEQQDRGLAALLMGDQEQNSRLMIEELTKLLVEEGDGATGDAMREELVKILSMSNTGGASQQTAESSLHAGFSADAAKAEDIPTTQPPPAPSSPFAEPAAITELAKRAEAALLRRFRDSSSTADPSKRVLVGKPFFPSTKLLTGEEIWTARQQAVVQATQETWKAYGNHAFGSDELLPLSMKGSDKWGGLGMMILDSLDTLHLMGLRQEYDRAVRWVAENLDLNHTATVSLFETTIRAVGGLLSAYDLSGDPLLLSKAGLLTAKLLPAFHGGVFPSNVAALNGEQVPEAQASLAEFGTLSVELHALGARTGIPELAALAQIPMRVLDDFYPERGLLPTRFNRTSGRAMLEDQDAELSIAGNQDSYYEYMLKMWLLVKEDKFRDMWVRAMDETLQKLVLAVGGELAIGARQNSRFQSRMDHLACFLPGNFALGVMTNAVTGDKAQIYLQAARNLTDSCWHMYSRTATGLSGEAVLATADIMLVADGANILRPETVESLFYLWKATGDEIYRERGWQIFSAFMMYSRTEQGAFAKIRNVNEIPVAQMDEMATFWTAETLKYLWLLFAPEDVTPITNFREWVFNTEAHPVKVTVTRS